MIFSTLLSVLLFLMGAPPLNVEPMDRLVAVHGQRANSEVYYHEGYCYHRDTRNRRIFRCQTRSRTTCEGRLYTFDDDMTVNRGRTMQHSCGEVDFAYLQKADFKRELYRRCRETVRDFIDIYEELILEPRHREAAEALGFYELRATMRSHRARELPATPQTLLQLADRIGNFAPIARYYSGFVQGEQDSVALIFINPELRNALADVRALFGDGTFKIRPSDPRDIAQVYTFHFTQFGVGFPPILCLTNRKITGLYVVMLQYILHQIPELRNLHIFHVDFERAMINAVIEVLPNTRIGGCYFHYTQAIVKFWKKQLGKGETPEENRVLALLLALPFLRPADMDISVAQIVMYMIRQDMAHSDRLARYFHRMWLPLAHIITVYQRRTRTNNTSEAFHKQAERLIGARQTLWRFLERLGRMMTRDAIHYDSVMNGHVRPVRTQDLIDFNTWLDNNEHRYNEDGPFQYLQNIAVERDRLHFHQFVM